MAAGAGDSKGRRLAPLACGTVLVFTNYYINTVMKKSFNIYYLLLIINQILIESIMHQSSGTTLSSEATEPVSFGKLTTKQPHGERVGAEATQGGIEREVREERRREEGGRERRRRQQRSSPQLHTQAAEQHRRTDAMHMMQQDSMRVSE